jgi:ParB-like chromosome segregation protein Spo0J
MAQTNPRNYPEQQLRLETGKYSLVAIDTVKPNTFNYNVQTPIMFGKLVASMREFGFPSPLIVRTLEDGSREIIGGEHRWRAAQQLGLVKVPIVDMGKVPDVRAQQLAIILNELGGEPDQVRLADLLRTIHTELGLDEMERVMPFSDKELALYTDVVDFGFANLSGDDTRPHEEQEQDQEAAAAAEGEDGNGNGARPAGRLVLSFDPADAKALKKQLAKIDPDPATAVKRAVGFYIEERGTRRAAT